MKPLFYILLLLSPLQSVGQNVGRFSKLFDENDLWQGFAAGIEKSDKNYLLAGVNIGFWWSDFYIWNCVVNSQGDTIATARIKSGDSSTYYIGFQALVRENKCFFLAGTQEEYVNQIQKDDGYLMKLDEKGGRVWQRNYGGSDFDGFDAMTMNAQKDLILAGVSFSFSDSTQGDVYVVKTDTAGEAIWEKTLGDNNFPERCFNVDTTADGGFVLAGVQGFEFGGQDIFVIKITGDGEFVWKKTFGYPQKDDSHFPRVRCLKNGDILLTTALRPNIDNRAHAYITRLSSSSGNTIWEKYYPGTDWNTWFNFAIELPGGNLVSAGGIMELDPTYPNYYTVLGALTKTDAEGNLIWKRKYYTRHDIDNYFFCMTPTSDAGFLMGGFAYRDDNNRQDAWAVKVDSLGCLEPGCDSSVAASEANVVGWLHVYPNPASAWITVEAQDEPMLGLRLTDIDGHTVEDVQFFRQHLIRQYKFSVATLPPGTYILSVRTDKGWASEKVVKN